MKTPNGTTNEVAKPVNESHRNATRVAFLLFVVGALLGAYALRVIHKRDYIVARNLRVLATLVSQIDAAASQPATDLAPAHGQATDKLPAPEAMLREIFSQRFLAVFDVLVVSDWNGKILKQTPGPGATPLPTAFSNTSRPVKDRIGSPVSIILDLAAVDQSSSFGKWQPLKPGDLRGAGKRTEVRVMETDYYLFTQPYVPAKLTEETRVGDLPDGSKRNTSGWLIGALVPKRIFWLEVLAVSDSIVAAGLAVLVLAFSCWPFLRIALVSERKPMRTSDVVLACLGAIVGGCTITITIGDTFVMRRLAALEDYQLKLYGRELTRNFDQDLQRAVQLAKALQTWSDHALLSKTLELKAVSDLEKAPDIWKSSQVFDYPYFSSLAWSDEKGMEVMKATVGSSTPPLDKVLDRPYFQDVLADRLWNIDVKGVPLAFAMDPVRWSGTGKQATVLALPRQGPPEKAYFAVTVPLIHLVDPVVPAGFGYTVIDERGNVIFHSDRTRNNGENFFRETDENRLLRSAVSARHEAMVNGRYWGVDHKLFVAPLANTPWSMVAFRDKTLLRTVNSEAVALTILLMAVYALLYALAFICLGVVKPSYRAPWLWPDATRDGHYRKLLLVLVVESIVFGLSIYFFSPRDILLIAFIAPFRTVANVYLVLHATAWNKLKWFAVVVSVMLTVLGLYVVMQGLVDIRLTFYPITRELLALLNLVTLLTSLYPTPGRSQSADQNSSAYIPCAALILFVIAVLPAAAFFKTATRLQIEMRVKYAQLIVADGLERRLNHLEAINARNIRIALDAYPMPHVFSSQWSLQPRATVDRPVSQDSSPGSSSLSQRASEPSVQTVDCECQASQAKTTNGNGGVRAGQASSRRPGWLPELLDAWLPLYSESSVVMRGLQFDRSADDAWCWCRDRLGDFTLRKKVSLTKQTRGRLYGTGSVQVTQAILVKSSLPMLLALGSAPSQTVSSSVKGYRFWQIVRAALYLTFAGMAVFILYSAVRFIAVRVFLIDLQEPLWFNHSKLISAPVGANLYVWRPAGDPITNLVEPGTFVNIHLAGNDRPKSLLNRWRLKSDRIWDRLLLEVESEPLNKDVLICDFEYKLDDAGFNAGKLSFLERLVSLPGREVVLLSTVSPMYILSAAPLPTRDLGRWQELLGSFVWISGDMIGRPEPPPGRDLLETETSNDRFLFSLRPPLAAIDGQSARILDEISERADSYYARLWAACTIDEKLMLYHLALYGLLNGKNRRVARRLLARRLISRSPQIKIFNETFRRYVVSAGKKDDLRAYEMAGGPTLWERWRVSIAAVLLTGLVLLLSTQPELFNTTSALITGLVAGLTLLIKLIGLLGAGQQSVIDDR